jgi:hypothetical protein
MKLADFVLIEAIIRDLRARTKEESAARRPPGAESVNPPEPRNHTRRHPRRLADGLGSHPGLGL